jgi:hypothetical protein
MSYCCAMVSKGERERGKEAGCALRWEDANKSPQESVVGERRCRERAGLSRSAKVKVDAACFTGRIAGKV